MKNIQNIREAVQSQQAYMTVLSGHINTYPHPQLDIIQLNAPDYDADIDREPDPVTDVQPSNAKSGKEDTSTGTSKSEDHTTVPLTTNRPEHQPSEACQTSTPMNMTTLNKTCRTSQRLQPPT